VLQQQGFIKIRNCSAPVSLAEFAPAGANKIKSILGENRIFDQNTSRGANVRAKRVR
jgi:hypothetical protein